ncbi:MAG: sugar transferase [Rhabdochlamydiaceae bacterium]|nr:sugar transferase [Candidatus Amphrikana amoebophyrae]
MKNQPTKLYLFGKRLFDILFSILVLIFGSPIFFAIALLVKLTSKGPAFYSCIRVKESFKTFSIFKFRTMYCDADERLIKMLDEDEEVRKEWAQYYKLKNDPRITKVGHFLRKTSLDELPQFINVLLGDMSLVGPRPFAPVKKDCSIKEELTQYLGYDGLAIFSIKPGLTGLWQTSGRSNLTLEQRIKLDVEYIEKRNFLLDLRLIAKTVPLMINPKGAY